MNVMPMNDATWTRVHAALDQGQDPLADAAVAQALAADPDLALEVCGLLQTLHEWQDADRPQALQRSGSRPSLGPKALGGALVAILLAIWLRAGLWPGKKAPELNGLAPEIAPLALRIPPPRFRLEIVESTASGVRTLTHTNASISIQHTPAPGSSVAHLGVEQIIHLPPAD